MTGVLYNPPVPSARQLRKAHLAADYRALASATRDLAMSIRRHSPTNPGAIRAAEELEEQGRVHDQAAERIRELPEGVRIFR